MAVRIRNAALLLVLFAGLLSNPPDLSSCGPFLPTAAFTFWRTPDDPPGRFARGQLGIIQPGFPRFYLIIAYRYLAGIGLNADERAALFGPEPPYQSPWSAEESEAVKHWQEERSRVAPGAAQARITTYKSISGGGYYVNYLNCGDDAFLSATRTLADRIHQLGLQSPAVKEWVAAQDQVFANCSGGPSIPAPLDSSTSPLRRADRTYQIAAAYFYAGNHAAAEQMFRAISAGHGSPWSGLAPYLVARSLVRKATLSVKGQGFDRESLTAAESQLQGILDDPTQSAVHPAARRLLDYVGARLRPAETMHTLAEGLVRKQAQATIQQTAIDYRFLFDQFENGNFGGSKALPAGDDLTNWILSFQSRDNDNREKALSEWRARGTMPWLIAALSVASGDDGAAGELITAGQKVAPDSPAYATAVFHSIRLMEELKHTAEARATLDTLLASPADTIPESSLNLFRAERMKVAATWDEFLKYSVRMSVGSAVGFLAQPEMEEPDPPQTKPRPGFDVDATKILNEHTPVNLLLDAARREKLPHPMRREIAMAGWVRSILLSDEKAARLLAPVLQNLAPELRPSLQQYLDAPDSRARAFAAVFLILRNPGMRPYVDVGFGRETPVNKIDKYRDNWWCSFAPGPNATLPGYSRSASFAGEPWRELYKDGAPWLQFLSPDERASAQREWLELAKLPSAPDYLAAQAIEWAKRNTSDPRTPEALHLAVRATRYGCSEQKTPFSRQAFELLHKQYPNSEWAQKTKYWY